MPDGDDRRFLELTSPAPLSKRTPEDPQPPPAEHVATILSAMGEKSQSGVPARELAERAGHARPSMSLDVYSHVMPSDELDSGRIRALVDAGRPWRWCLGGVWDYASEAQSRTVARVLDLFV